MTVPRKIVHINAELVDELTTHCKDYHLLSTHQTMTYDKEGKPPSQRILIETVIIKFIEAQKKKCNGP